jgi:anaerobic ribonucleoside-triphosphate reductase
MELVKKKCDKKPEVYSRVVGYFRPIDGWNKGKQAEYKDRISFKQMPVIYSDFIMAEKNIK